MVVPRTFFVGFFELVAERGTFGRGEMSVGRGARSVLVAGRGALFAERGAK